MNELPPDPLIEFNTNQMAQVRKTFNYEDINRLKQDLTLFEEWIKAQPHYLVKEYDKEYLERYLINSKGSIERAKKLFDRMCTLRGLMPEYLHGFDIENEFKNHQYCFNACVLPKPTPDNYRIIYYTLRNQDFSKFEHIDVGRFIIVILQYLNCHDYNAGVHIIWDTRKCTLGFATKLSPIVVANTLMIMNEAVGLRMRGLHLVGGSKFIDVIVAIVKKGLSKKLTDRFHVHEDFESLFKSIPKDILPKDIGGGVGSTDEIAEKTYKILTTPEFVKHMKFIESAATNESKRVRSKFNEEYLGMPGSFKVLSVD